MAKRYDLDDLLKMTLNEVNRLYCVGLVDSDAVDAYIRAWNAGPCRFTRAYRMDGAIRNVERDD